MIFCESPGKSLPSHTIRLEHSKTIYYCHKAYYLCRQFLLVHVGPEAIMSDAWCFIFMTKGSILAPWGAQGKHGSRKNDMLGTKIKC